MKKFGNFICKNKNIILIISLLLLIPAFIGMAKTKINYDILVYLPKEIETVQGQNILADDFDMGAFSITIIDNMDPKDILKLESQIKEIKGVEKVITAYDLVGTNIPLEVLPANIYTKIKKDNSTLMMVTYTDSTSAESTLAAVNKVKEITKDNIKVGGMSAVVLDTMELSEKEIAIYIIIAVVLCIIVLELSLDSYLVPFLLLLNIGIAILFNLGTNIFLGEISYITKALVAVLQLGVTTDFSIFLYHSYDRNKMIFKTKEEAMSTAISETFTSVIGSSLTTIAGFLVLCTMNLTLGKDLGIVMAKGVLFGVVCVLTIFPVLLLTFDKYVVKSKHKSILPTFKKINEFTIKHHKVFFALFLILLVPAYLANSKVDIYYKLDKSLPRNLDSIVANETLANKFNIVSPEIILIDKNIKTNDLNKMVKELKNIDGIDLVLSSSELENLGLSIDMLSDDVKKIFESNNYQMLLINSNYEIASKDLNAQVDKVNTIIKKYDNKSILAGEGPLMKDLVEISNKDFNNVNYSSIACILIIMLFVLKSYTLPILLIMAIEFAIFINLSIPYFMGETLPFVAQIVLGTIQLGATIDYAILMTTTYLSKRKEGKDKNISIKETLNTCTSSILVSGLCFFAATFGVGIYSKLEMISSLCMLISRGAIISMAVVIFILPSILLIFDKLICNSTFNFRKERGNMKKLKTASIMLLLALPLNTLALTKDETVYVNLNSDGSMHSSFVSEHLINNSKSKKIEDLSGLTDIINTNGNETFVKDSYHLLWNAEGEDIFYRGTTKKDLPISVKLNYYLDGKEISLNDLLSSSGKVTIKISYTNKEKHYSSKTKSNLYTPFIVTLGTMIDSENNSNIKVNNGKIINNGNKYMIAAIALPGMYDSLKIDSLKTLDTITISYDTKRFELPNMYMVVNSKLIESSDLKLFGEIDNLYSGVSELKTSIEKIQKGSKELSEGANKINEGTSLISKNLSVVSSKLSDIASGATSIDEGLKQILLELKKSKELLNNPENIKKINDLNTLIEKNSLVIKTLDNKEAQSAYQTFNLSSLSNEQISSFTKEAYASFGLTFTDEEASSMNSKLLQAKQSVELSLLLEKNNEALNGTIETMTNTTKQLSELINTLESYLEKIEGGANTLANGTNQIKSGVKVLSNKTKELNAGTDSLYNGSKELNAGITMFNEQGITKLVNATNDIKKAEVKVKELIKLGEEYDSFDMKKSGTNGNTKFIVTLSGAKEEENQEEKEEVVVKTSLWTKIKNLFK